MWDTHFSSRLKLITTTGWKGELKLISTKWCNYIVLDRSVSLGLIINWQWHAANPFLPAVSLADCLVHSQCPVPVADAGLPLSFQCIPPLPVASLCFCAWGLSEALEGSPASLWELPEVSWNNASSEQPSAYKLRKPVWKYSSPHGPWVEHSGLSLYP